MAEYLSSSSLILYKSGGEQYCVMNPSRGKQQESQQENYTNYVNIDTNQIVEPLQIPKRF